jgi:hypothetical protein
LLWNWTNLNFTATQNHERRSMIAVPHTYERAGVRGIGLETSWMNCDVHVIAWENGEVQRIRNAESVLQENSITVLSCNVTVATEEVHPDRKDGNVGPIGPNDQVIDGPGIAITAPEILITEGLVT